MNETYLSTFPANEIEALALLYVQTRDISDATPEDLLTMYDQACEKMLAVRKAQKRDREEWF